MVVTVEDGLLGISSDGRDGFKRWGKRVRPNEVDLSASNGHSLGGEWLTWGRAVALEEGDYLVLAAETGSRANHSYKYRLGQVRGGELIRIDEGTRDALFAGAPVTDRERANLANSLLYAYAAYIHYAGMAPAAPDETNTAQAQKGIDLSAVPTETLLAELRRRGVPAEAP